MKLTTEQVVALRHLFAATPLMVSGDHLVEYYKREYNATKEAAEGFAIADLKTLIRLSSDVKEYLA